MNYMLRMIFVAFFVLSKPLAADERYALVIGNSSYDHVADLLNPGNDADSVANALRSLGYDVDRQDDLTRNQMLDTLLDFRRRTNGADHAIIYYAGHGIEIDRSNYLVPVDAELASDLDVNFEAIPLEQLMLAVSGAEGLSVVILDACRDNPFLASMSRTLGTRSIWSGPLKVVHQLG